MFDMSAFREVVPQREVDLQHELARAQERIWQLEQDLWHAQLDQEAAGKIMFGEPKSSRTRICPVWGCKETIRHDDPSLTCPVHR